MRVNFVIGLLIGLIASIVAFQISFCLCTFKSSCNADEVEVLQLTDLKNAHAALPSSISGISYAYKLCCSKPPLDSVINATGSCPNATEIIRLSNTTNAHAEIPSYTNYSYLVCVNASPLYIFDCQVQSGDCPTDYIAILSLSNYSNAHIASGAEYNIKVCCRSAKVVDISAGTTDLKYIPLGTSVDIPITISARKAPINVTIKVSGNAGLGTPTPTAISYQLKGISYCPDPCLKFDTPGKKLFTLRIYTTVVGGLNVKVSAIVNGAEIDSVNINGTVYSAKLKFVNYRIAPGLNIYAIITVLLLSLAFLGKLLSSRKLFITA